MKPTQDPYASETLDSDVMRMQVKHCVNATLGLPVFFRELVHNEVVVNDGMLSIKTLLSANLPRCTVCQKFIANTHASVTMHKESTNKRRRCS